MNFEDRIMKILGTLATLGCVVIVGCGGNWSNKDLEFLNALPTREQLSSKLPTGTGKGLSGEGTRRDGLSVGEPSKMYADTKGASSQFNGILEFVIGVIEVVRALPATTRTADSRTWGPWPDRENAGFEFQVVIKQIDAENFGYVFQHRPTGGAFFDTVTGSFKATASLRKGEGLLTIHCKQAAASLPSAVAFKPLDKIEIGYFTESFPTRVEMVFAIAAGQPSLLSSIGYTYREQENKSGLIHFAVRTSSPDITVYDAVSFWLASGVGTATSTVTEGNFKGATQTECWDSAFNLTFAKQTWPGGVEVGEKSSCVSVPTFSP
jgi:hypothetical protein